MLEIKSILRLHGLLQEGEAHGAADLGGNWCLFPSHWPQLLKFLFPLRTDLRYFASRTSSYDVAPTTSPLLWRRVTLLPASFSTEPHHKKQATVERYSQLDGGCRQTNEWLLHPWHS